MERLVEVDSKRRAVLGRLGHKEHSRYLAHDLPDGTIVLVPAEIRPITANLSRVLDRDPDAIRSELVEPSGELAELLDCDEAELDRRLAARAKRS